MGVRSLFNREKDPKKLAKICVVDDSNLSRKIMTQILKEEGYNVVGEAESAEKAIGLIGSHDINFFIVDIVMPGANGIELTKKILDNIRAHVMIVSSLTQEHILLESISAGASDFIHKPFRKQDFLNAVEKICDQIVEATIV
jgi:two-component system, chemotaxis family, chemotaxis protein CheY